MVGAGTIINPILKVVTTVAILAAVYFFIVKPSLETTERISSGINENSQNISESIRDTIQESQAGTNAQIDQALDQAEAAIKDAGIKGERRPDRPPRVRPGRRRRHRRDAKPARGRRPPPAATSAR